MALERNNPLPPGRYWVDVPPQDAKAFDSWLSSNKGALEVRSTSQSNSDGWQWILFDVTAPAMVFWQGPGYPTIADASVTTESQVKQIPAPQGASPADFAGKILVGAAPWILAGWLGTVLIKRIIR